MGGRKSILIYHSVPVCNTLNPLNKVYLLISSHVDPCLLIWSWHNWSRGAWAKPKTTRHNSTGCPHAISWLPSNIIDNSTPCQTTQPSSVKLMTPPHANQVFKPSLPSLKIVLNSTKLLLWVKRRKTEGTKYRPPGWCSIFSLSFQTILSRIVMELDES